MRKLLLFAVVLYLVAPPVALSAPKALSAKECAVLADAALVSGAAAKRGVPRATVEAMLPDIYVINDKARVDALFQAVLDVIFGATRSQAPVTFANALKKACMEKEGDMDSILGTGA